MSDKVTIDVNGITISAPAPMVAKAVIAMAVGAKLVEPEPPALEWSKTLRAGNRMTYAEAESAVAELDNGWRMPTKKELESLVDVTRHDPAIDIEKYPDTKSALYWTSTPCTWDTSAVWVVGFRNGSADDFPRNYGACVRAVRASSAGQ